MPSLGRSVPKPLKVPSLARSVHKPLKVPSLARSVLKPLKEPSFARSVPKPLSSRLCMVSIGRLPFFASENMNVVNVENVSGFVNH